MSFKGLSGKGAIYTRWGRNSCPNTNGTELVYSGRAGGSFFRGGGAQLLCLPDNIDYLNETAGSGVSGRSEIYGTAYEFGGNIRFPHSSLQGHNVPCAVCYISTRTSVLMIPAKTQCPLSWTREYYGYLTTDRATFHRQTFQCVDSSPEAVPGGGSDFHSARFVYTSAHCHQDLACPPYEPNRILSCTVCTK